MNWTRGEVCERLNVPKEHHARFVTKQNALGVSVFVDGQWFCTFYDGGYPHISPVTLRYVRDLCK